MALIPTPGSAPDPRRAPAAPASTGVRCRSCGAMLRLSLPEGRTVTARRERVVGHVEQTCSCGAALRVPVAESR